VPRTPRWRSLLAIGLCGAVLGGAAAGSAAARSRMLAQPAAALDAACSPAVAAYRRVGPAVVLVANQLTVATTLGAQQRTGWGSGLVFDARGYIVTNDHVVAGASRLSVTLADGTVLPAQLVGGDPSTDLAVVRVHAGRPLPVAVFGDSRTVEPGELAIAIGNPLGPQFAQSVTQGVVSAVRPMLYGLTAGTERVTEMIQTDAAINPGNSGGPLLNAAGQVIGITSVKVAQAQPGLAASGLGFAIPSDAVRRVVDDLVRYGRVRRAWLGVALRVTPPEALPGEAQAVAVSALSPGGPAARAGLEAGDRLVRWNRTAVSNYYALVLAINAAAPGQRVQLTVERAGRTLAREVTLGAEPETAPA